MLLTLNGAKMKKKPACPPFVLSADALPLKSNLPLCVTRNHQFSEASTDFSYLVCVHSYVSVWL